MTTQILKYKGWNTNQNIMYSAEELGKDELTISPDGHGFVNINDMSQKLSQYMPHILPLQFTGLYDKNGAEIYEGDIIKHSSDIVKCFVVKHKLSHSGRSGFTILGHVHKREVIGNIYENPKLIQ